MMIQFVIIAFAVWGLFSIYVVYHLGGLDSFNSHEFLESIVNTSECVRISNEPIYFGPLTYEESFPKTFIQGFSTLLFNYFQ